MPVVSDVRHALRSLRLRPGWALATIATLALAIGANATMFGLVDRLLLRPPPHLHEPSRLMQLSFEYDDGGGRFAMSTTSYPMFTDVAGAVRGFSGVAGVANGAMVLGAGADARSLQAAKVTPQYFALLGSQPGLGRFLGPADGNVAVVSYALWRREFSGERSVLGREITLDGSRYQVVGVAPADFTGDDVEPVDVWVPLAAAMEGGPADWREARNMRLVRIVARLADGVAPSVAAEQASVIASRDARTARVRLASVAPGWSARREPSAQGRVALWVAAMSLVVFLIAIVNVANLMLLRGAARRREVAVRLALGATARDLARALVVESLLLAVLGGIAAIFVAAWGSEAIRATLLPALAPADHLVSLRLVVITAAATIAAGLLTAVVPAFRAARASVVDDLKTGGAAAGRTRSAVPGALLVAQASLCMLLLIGASLFVLSLHRVRTQDFGFKSEGVLIAELKFEGSPPGAVQDALYTQAAERLSGLLGIQVVSVNQVVPFIHHHVPPISVAGRPDFPDERQQAPFLNAATPTYFRALGMAIRQGRNFTATDRAGSPLVIIINQAMADGLWPGESPIGRCIRVGYLPGEMPMGIHAPDALPCREVVGVVNNARPRSIREESGQARMQYYIPFGQMPQGPFAHGQAEIWSLLIRTADADAMSGLVQRTLQSATPQVTLADVRPLQDVLDRQMRPWLLGATMFSAFGLLALVLAAIGLYGVRAYAVTQRTQEIGIRVALGAPASVVVRMILLDGVRVTSIGVAIGAAAALAAGRYLEPLLFQTHAANLGVFAVIAVTLAIVATAASAVPAWRAAHVDPNVALRSE